MTLTTIRKGETERNKKWRVERGPHFNEGAEKRRELFGVGHDVSVL